MIVSSTKLPNKTISLPSRRSRKSHNQPPQEGEREEGKAAMNGSPSSSPSPSSSSSTFAIPLKLERAASSQPTFLLWNEEGWAESYTLRSWDCISVTTGESWQILVFDAVLSIFLVYVKLQDNKLTKIFSWVRLAVTNPIGDTKVVNVCPTALIFYRKYTQSKFQNSKKIQVGHTELSWI